MKNKHSVLILIVILVFCTACTTTNSATSTASVTEQEKIFQQDIPVEKEINLAENNSNNSEKEAPTEDISNTTISPTSEQTESEAIEKVIVNPVENLLISAGKTPAEIKKNGTFKIPFTATVTNTEDGSPAVDFPVTVIYPKTRQNDTVTFESQELITNQEGQVSFSIPDTSFACNSFVTFKIGNDEFEKSVEIPYKVATNRYNWGGTISILDYNKKGNPVTDNSLSASAILTSLMRKGFTGIGLADFVNEINSGKTENVYKAAYNLIGNNSSYLIFGTVKYNGEITKEGTNVTIPMIAEITCLEMKTGNELYHTVIEVEGKGNSEWAALNNARNELIGPQIAEKIIYGL